MTRVIINLHKSELKALVNLAEREYRDTRQQAALIIRQELERRGFLAIETQADSAQALPMQSAAHETKQGGINANQ